MEWLQDILAAVFYLGDTFGEGLVALSLGFAAKATGIGFLVRARISRQKNVQWRNL